MTATMLRTAVLAAAAACVVGVRKNRGADSLVDDLDMEQVSEGPPAEKWCSLEDHTLSCGEGTFIEIEKAQYSRQKNAGCRPPVEDAAAGVDCDVTVTDTLAAECDGRQECKVPASFHSSCPKSPFSYLRVRFECKEGAARKEQVAATTTEKEEKPATTMKKEEKLIVLPSEEAAPTTTEGEKLFVLPSHPAAATTTKPTGPAPLRRYSRFLVWIKTSDEWWSGTDDTIYIKLMGEGGDLDWQKLDYFFHNDFERSSLQAYHVTSAMPIAATSVCLKKEKAGFVNDAWLPDFVKVFEDETGTPAEMIGLADGWDWFKDENPVCKPLKN